MKINYTGINHMAMATGDINATIAFWRDLLGMRLVAGLGRPGYRHYFFEISAHDMIAFFEWPGIEPLPEKDHGVPVKGPFAFDHVSFEVRDQEDLWQLKQRLEDADQWVSEVIDHGFIYSIYTFDPNHIPIEFSWPVTDVDLRQNPCMADTAPSVLATEGSEPQPGRWPRRVRDSSGEKRTVYPGEGTVLLDKDACWDHPNLNRDRYRDRSDMTLGHEKVDFDPDSDFDPDENGSQQTDARDAYSSRQ